MGHVLPKQHYQNSEKKLKATEPNHDKLAPYGTGGRLLLTADFKVTWHKN